MSKIGALFHNEIIKMRKRVSVLVITVIMIAAIIGISGLIKIEDVRFDSGYDTYPTYDMYGSDLAGTKDYLEQLETEITAAKEKGDTENLMYLYNEKIYNLTYCAILELRIDYTDTGSSDFRNDLIDGLSVYLEKINQYTVMEEAFPGTQDKAEYASAQQTVTALTEILKQQDYAGYVEYSKDLIRSMTDISQEEKELLLEKWDILLKLDPTGGIGDDREESRTEYARNAANTVEALAKTIIYERDFTNGANGTGSVTPKQLEDCKDTLATVRYCIDNGIEIFNADGSMASAAYSLVSSIANSLITLLLIILAGAIISNEIATGSIKSLIIAPVRRWKIFTAKLLALLSVATALMLVKYICIVGTQSLFWPDAILPYVYASSGTAHSMNYYLYQLLYCFAELMPIFMVAVFALMLSATTRNTALSVGLSMGIYFGGSVAASILNVFSSGEWLKFIPFNNMDLADKLFSMSALTPNYGNVSMPGSTSALFTLVYIIVLSLCMLYIAFDSFTRRDI